MPSDSPRPRRPLPPDDDDWAELEREVQRTWIRSRLGESLDRLSPEQREVVELRFFENWDTRLIAETTNRNVATVRRLLAEALVRLREGFSGHEGSPR